MFIRVFFTILKSIALPIVAFIALRSSVVGEQGAFLAVTIALTIINIVSVLFGLVKILPNALLLRGGAVIGIILSILIEVSSVAGFWLYYLAKYN